MKYYYYTYVAVIILLCIISFDIFYNVEGGKIENVPFYLRKSDAEIEREEKLQAKMKEIEDRRIENLKKEESFR